MKNVFWEQLKTVMLYKFWKDYQTLFEYAQDIEFKDICRIIKEILDETLRN